MQIYKLFGSLQYKVVKISHILGDFYNSTDFTYINYTKNRLSAKANSLKLNGSVAPELFCVKKFGKNFLTKISSLTKNILPKKIV